MSQQIINIGAAPHDGTGDQLRVSFDKCNDNFTELYTSGAGTTTEGVWNFNQTDIDTNSAPTSGRFRTNTGDFATATQIAIHRTSINGIDRANTLRTQVTGDIIKCQDQVNADSWCRYILQSDAIDNGTWFQLNVAFDGGGGTAPGNNQEIIFAFTASSAGGGGGGNVSNVGTPTNGQLAQWTDATHIQGIDSSSLGFAPLASPAFIGTPTAPTVAVGTSTTQIATTAFVDAESVAKVGDTMTGALVLPADPTAALQAAPKQYVDAKTVQSPQGRLTLASATPVMTTTQAAKTTIFYTPYVGNLVPIFDGTNFIMTSIGSEISVATTDTTKNPAAIGASKINDWFVWNDAGTIRIGHGPDWTNDTTRSAGTVLTKVNGILLNNAAITNGPAASRGTYVGTTRSNASSQLDFIFPAVSAGGTAGVFGVWNAYNRVTISGFVGDNGASTYTYAVADYRQFRGQTNMAIFYVCGLSEDGISAECSTTVSGPTVNASVGVGVGSTTVASGMKGYAVGTSPTFPCVGSYGGLMAPGYSGVFPLEWAAATTTFYPYGTSAGDEYLMSGLRVRIRG